MAVSYFSSITCGGEGLVNYSTLFIRALETKTIRQAQKEREQSRDFLGVGTACACVCAKHRREQCRGSIFSMLKHGAAVLKHAKNAPEALLPSVLSTHTGACTTPKKSSDWSISFCACLIV